METNEKDIKSVIDDWVVCIQEKNLDALLQNRPSDILMFDVPEPLQYQGLAQYQKSWELFFRVNPGGKDAFQLEDLHIHASDTIAFCTALIKLSKDKGPECRLTLGLKKIQGQWIIVHEHHSAPHPID